jgi:hypothetical protein
MNAADGSQVPVQATSGLIQDTSEEVPTEQADFSRFNGSTMSAVSSDPGEALRNPLVGEMNKLRTFLMMAYPREMHRSNLTKAETPVDVAIRLLKGLSSTAPGPRCTDEYCNLPLNHDGPHGFVNFQSR